MKRKIIYLSILLVLIGCSVYLFSTMNPARLMVPDSWKNDAFLSISSTIERIEKGKYESVAFIIRQNKLEAEAFGMKRSDYLSYIEKVKQRLPASVDIKRLPYDLSQKNHSKILFGLCARGKRLHGELRDAELYRFANEINAARKAKDNWAYNAYLDKIENLLKRKRLELSDLDKLELDMSEEIAEDLKAIRKRVREHYNKLNATS